MIVGGIPLLMMGDDIFDPSLLFTSGENGGWYDPSDISTLWQDTSASTPVTASGQDVARIDDKSGNGNHLVQGSSGLRPIYQSAGGLSWLAFDGSDDILVAQSDTVFNFDRDDAFATAMQIDFDADPSAFHFYMGKQETGGGKGWAVRNGGTDSRQKLNITLNSTGTDQIFTSTTADVLNAGNSSVISVYDGSSLRDGVSVYVDADSKTMDEDGGASVSGSITTSETFSIGKRLDGGGGAVNADFYGMLVVERALSANEITQLHDWLASKASS